MFSSPGLASTQRARAAGDQSMPDLFPVDSDSPGPSRNTVPTAEDSDDEEVIIGAAYRIATEVRVGYPHLPTAGHIHSLARSQPFRRR